MSQENKRIPLGIGKPTSATVIIQHTDDPNQSTSVSIWYVNELILTISGEEFGKLVKSIKENWKGKNCPV